VGGKKGDCNPSKNASNKIEEQNRQAEKGTRGFLLSGFRSNRNDGERKTANKLIYKKGAAKKNGEKHPTGL